MPVDSGGVYGLPSGSTAVSGQTALASQHNNPVNDIAAALNLALWRDGRAPLTGNLSASGFKITNAANGSSDQDYVTMAQLNDVIASVTLARVPTGAVQGFRRTTPPTGWIKENGGTIGNAASGATNRANADTEALFTLLWGQFSNTILPIQDSTGAASTRGASAATDFAANKRMPLFDSRSRFLRAADDGLGYDATLTVGAVQADALQNITGTIDLVHSTASGSGAFTGSSISGDRPSVGANGASRLTFNASNVVRTSTETRPRSSVVLHCIKL